MRQKGKFSTQHFIDSPHHVVITTCSGDLTYADSVASLLALRRDPSFRPNYRQLSDLSQTSKLQLDLPSLKEIYCRHDSFSNEGKRAMVAPEGGVAFRVRPDVPVARGERSVRNLPIATGGHRMAGRGSNDPPGGQPAGALRPANTRPRSMVPFSTCRLTFPARSAEFAGGSRQRGLDAVTLVTRGCSGQNGSQTVSQFFCRMGGGGRTSISRQSGAGGPLSRPASAK